MRNVDVFQRSSRFGIGNGLAQCRGHAITASNDAQAHAFRDAVRVSVSKYSAAIATMALTSAGGRFSSPRKAQKV